MNRITNVYQPVRVRTPRLGDPNAFHKTVTLYGVGGGISTVLQDVVKCQIWKNDWSFVWSTIRGTDELTMLLDSIEL